VEVTGRSVVSGPTAAAVLSVEAGPHVVTDPRGAPDPSAAIGLSGIGLSGMGVRTVPAPAEAAIGDRRPGSGATVRSGMPAATASIAAAVPTAATVARRIASTIPSYPTRSPALSSTTT
jgi:hypothetical protein